MFPFFYQKAPQADPNLLFEIDSEHSPECSWRAGQDGIQLIHFLDFLRRGPGALLQRPCMAEEKDSPDRGKLFVLCGVEPSLRRTADYFHCR